MCLEQYFKLRGVLGVIVAVLRMVALTSSRCCAVLDSSDSSPSTGVLLLITLPASQEDPRLWLVACQ